MNQKIKSSLSWLLWELRLRSWHSKVWFYLYSKVLDIRNSHLSSTMISEDSDLVIEGFPRSANTFVVHAIELCSPQPLKIAHHLHDPGQILLGISLNLPIFVIVRDPLASIASWHIKAPRMSLEQMFRIYDSFHKVALSNHSRVHFIRYEDVINDTPSVIEKVLESLSLKSKVMLQDFDSELVFQSIDARKILREGPKRHSQYDLSVARPNAKKEIAKKSVIADLEAAHTRNLKKSRNLYLACLEQTTKISSECENVSS